MSSENNETVLCSDLRTARETAGMDLQTLSLLTKVSQRVLQNIEEENHAALPNPAFVKGFVRLYAEAVGLDEEQTVRAYLESRDAYEKDLAAANKQPMRFSPAMLVSTAILAGIVGVVMYAMSGVGLETGPASHRYDSGETTAVPANVMQVPTEGAPPEKLAKQRLAIAPIEETWIKVIIDEQPSKAYTLKPGDSLELEANHRFNLLLGSADAVRLTLNGKPVEVVGRKNQAVTLQLP
jgi:cytoskeleton protein RodZ